MTLVRFRPALDNDQIVPRTFSQFLDTVFDDMITGTRPMEGNYTPGVDVIESDRGFEIQISLPGIKKEDINIDLDDRTLTVTGERKSFKEEDTRKYHLIESRFGTFSRVLTLPKNIDREKVDAIFEDGILKIMIEKMENAVTKQIQIK
jgi:HSP20 family protein